MELSQSEIEKILNLAVLAARNAGRKAIEELQHVSSTLKTPTELVTQADPLCQEIIINLIKKTVPWPRYHRRRRPPRLHAFSTAN